MLAVYSETFDVCELAAVNSWWLLNGCCQFLVAFAWLLSIPNALWTDNHHIGYAQTAVDHLLTAVS